MAATEKELKNLQPDSLDGKRTSYRLTRKSARMLGFPESATRRLGQTALIRRYAIQWFTEVDRKAERWLCNPREYPELFSVDAHRLPRGNFYVECVNQENRLGFVIEDFGSDVRRIVRRAIDHLDRFLEHGWFDDLIAGERFAISFLTVTQAKARSLERQFERGVDQRLSRALRQVTGQRHAMIHTDFLVVPGLIDLLPTHNSRGGGHVRTGRKEP